MKSSLQSCSNWRPRKDVANRSSGTDLSPVSDRYASHNQLMSDAVSPQDVGFFGLDTKSIIGDDDRNPVASTVRAPWRMICSLEIWWPGADAPAYGTGWLAGPNLVVTAAHCVFDHQQGLGWATKISVTPGRDRSEAPFGSYDANRFSATKAWQEVPGRNVDIGAIHLNDDLGRVVGWFTYGISDQVIVGGEPLTISGYSRRRAVHSTQQRASGVSVGVIEGRLFYTVDTLGGASGAPVLLGAVQDDTDTHVIAVHTDDETAVPPEIGVESNSGPLLVPEWTELIEQWSAFVRI